MRRIALVTGGAGFIGSHMVRTLLREGWNARVLDNFDTGLRANLEDVRQDVEIVAGDVRDFDVCRAACQGVESVFHLAAIASVVSSVETPALTHDVTLGGTLHMLTAARDQGVRRFIFSSSAAVYGNADTVPTSETQPILPQSPYATCKAAGEFYCRNFFDLYGLETVILRYFNVFGPRQPANSGYAAVVPCFVRAALEKRRPIVYGDGLQTRDFVSVTNVAEANLLAAQSPEAAGGIFNIAGGVGITLLDLLAELERLTGTTLSPEFRAARSGDVRHSRADIRAAQEKLGYVPRVSLHEGLKATLEFTAQQEILAAVSL